MAMTRKKQRTTLIISGLAVLGIGAGIILYFLNDSIVFFYTPSEVVEKKIKPSVRFRLGGLVDKGSVVRGKGTTVSFTVTDTSEKIPVRFTGTLPDLFREGQGVIAEGKLNPSGKFIADNVLAKHDENYMPKEVADSLKKQGYWQKTKGKQTGAKKAEDTPQ